MKAASMDPKLIDRLVKALHGSELFKKVPDEALGRMSSQAQLVQLQPDSLASPDSPGQLQLKFQLDQ